MRISDWSSDVCSSDLLHAPCPQSSGWRVELRGEPYYVYRWQTSKGVRCYASRRTDQSLRFQGGHEPRCLSTERSEEHTSELQSLMRISYAVFCLKKKNPISYYLHLTDTMDIMNYYVYTQHHITLHIHTNNI